MDSVVMGINEEELSSLALEISDYSDRVSEIFDKIDVQMERLSNNYQGPSATTIINYYKNLVPNFERIKNNINSYSEDLIALIKKMQENEKYLISLFQDAIEEISTKKKSIEK